MSHIFISYSRRDIDFAQKIVDALAANNLDTWIDWKSIPKGEDCEQEIYCGTKEAGTASTPQNQFILFKHQVMFLKDIWD